MENQKNNKGIVILLIIIIAILSALCILLATGTINFKSNKENNNDNEIKEKAPEKEEYDASEYIDLEDVVFNSKVSTKKVKLQNLSDDITKDFYKQQDEVIDSINISDSDIFNVEYKLEYFINDNILSILYTIEETNEIGTCANKMAVTNIDLKNNILITEEELLRKAGVTYDSIVDNEYEKELENWKKLNDDSDSEMAYYEVTFSDFRDNKEKYVDEGLKKIPDIIYTYIEDGKIKYDYYTIQMDTLFHLVGKGGCFNWGTVTLGDY